MAWRSVCRPRIARLLAHNPSPFTFRGTGVYLVGEDRSVAVIDPGPELPEHVEVADARARSAAKSSHILITHTHSDHSPAAAAAEGCDRRANLWLWPARAHNR